MALLHLLEGIRTPVLDTVMGLITYLGADAVFMAMGLMLYWCVSKRAGRYVIITGLVGTTVNQFLKLVFRVPRPWLRDETLTIVESARGGATGYSFPSGHSTAAVGVFGGIARWVKNKAVKAVCILIAVLVCFSRLYLGVHTPLDVAVGAATGLAALLVFHLFLGGKHGSARSTRITLLVCIALTAANLLFVKLYPFPADVDADNLAHGVKTGWQLLGGAIGLLLAVEHDERLLHFDTKAVWWAQILKLALGMALTMGLRIALKTPLYNLCGGDSMADGIRYLLIVIFAGCVWPLTFKWFAALGAKKDAR